MPEISIDTSVVCVQRYGPGGWATLLKMGKNERELSGGEVKTTDNRLELIAIIGGFVELNRMIHVAIDAGESVPQCHVTINSPTEFMVNAWNKKWLQSWQGRGWVTAAGKPVANRVLWERLVEVASVHTVTWKLVPINPLTERLAPLASEGRRHAVQDQRD